MADESYTVVSKKEYEVKILLVAEELSNGWLQMQEPQLKWAEEGIPSLLLVHAARALLSCAIATEPELKDKDRALGYFLRDFFTKALTPQPETPQPKEEGK
jgi:hypothetical protein